MPPTSDTDGAVFEQLRPRLHAISWRIVGSRAEAEDIVQDCFLKWHTAEQSALATPAAWLTTVVQHQSIDRLRSRAREAVAARTATELIPEAAPALPEDGLVQRAELSEALACLLACLSPSERVALILHDVFERNHAEIAAALRTNPTNARQYLARARRRLRAKNAEPPESERLCRELLRRFQAAINHMDMPAMVTLLCDEQPVQVRAAPQLRYDAGASANDAIFYLAMAA